MRRITINRGQILRNNPYWAGLDRFERNFPGVSDRKRFTIQQLLDAGTPTQDIVWALRCTAPVHHRKIREAATDYLSPNVRHKLGILTPHWVWHHMTYNDYPQYLRTPMKLDEEQNAH